MIFSLKLAIFWTEVTHVYSNTTKRFLIGRLSPKRVNLDEKCKIIHPLVFLETIFSTLLPVLQVFVLFNLSPAVVVVVVLFCFVLFCFFLFFSFFLFFILLFFLFALNLLRIGMRLKIYPKLEIIKRNS